MNEQEINSILKLLAEDNIMTKNDFLIKKFDDMDKKFNHIEHECKAIKNTNIWFLSVIGAILTIAFNHFEFVKWLVNKL